MRPQRLTAEQIRAIRSFAAPEHHPRLLLDGSERDVVLARTRAGISQQMAERLRMKCDAYTDPSHEQYCDLDSYDSTAILARPGQYQLGRIMKECAFAGWLWDEERYVELAKGIILRRAREAFQTQGGPSPEMDADDFSHCRSPLGIGTTGRALAFSVDLVRGYLTDDEWADVVAHVRDYYIAYAQRAFFEKDRLLGTGFNKTMLGMCSIGLLALAVAEDLEDDELDWALCEAHRSALGYCREAMDDDGGTYEGPGYGAHCVSAAIMLAEAMRRHGMPEFSRYEPFHRHAQWLAHLVVPGGGTIPFGDSNGVDVTPAVLLVANWRRDAAHQWTYLKGLGREDYPAGPFGDHFAIWNGILPEQIAWFDPDLAAAPPSDLGRPAAYHARGTDFVTFRSGWSEDAVMALVIGAGRRPTAHAHVCGEVGAIDLYAGGRSLLHDPGYGTTTPEAHSTVVVSDRSTDFEPGGGNARFGACVIRSAHGEFASSACVKMNQMLDCRWAFRDVVLVRGARPYLIVADDLNHRSDWAEYDWFWQVPPDADAAVPASDCPARITSGGVALDIHSFLPPDTSYDRPYECSWQDEEHEPHQWAPHESAPMRRLRMRVAGYTGTAVSLLIPRPAGSEGPVVTRVECCRPGIALRIDWEGTTDEIVFAPINRFVQTTSMVGAGRLAVVRSQEDAPCGHLLSDGYELAWNGMTLVEPRPRCGEVIVP